MTTGSRTEGVRGIGSNGFIRTVGNLTVTGDLVVLGENRALAGTGSFFWEDADANAEYWAFELPSGTSQHVPVLGVGVGLDGVDLGLFDGITQPTVAVMDADRDSAVALTFSADDVARIDLVGSVAQLGLGQDDDIISLGTDSDAAIVLQSAASIADATLTGVIEGTPQTPALAANSLIISNITDDGDILLAVSDGGHSRGVLHLDGNVGQLKIYAPGGNEVMRSYTGGIGFNASQVDGGDVGINSSDTADWVLFDVSAEELKFAAATTISTSAGDLTLDPTASLNVTLTDDDDDALTVSNSASVYYNIDTRNTQSNAVAHTFDTEDATVASLANGLTRYRLMETTAYNFNLTGTNQVTALVKNVDFEGSPTLIGAAAITVDKAATLVVKSYLSSTNVTLTHDSAIRIIDGAGGAGAVVSQSGIFIESMTGADSNNYAIYMEGTPVIHGSLPSASAATNISLDGSNNFQQDTSSIEFKDDVAPLDYDLDRLYDLQPRTFMWNDKSGSEGLKDYGFIAQEAAEVMPEVVNFKEDYGPWSMRWSVLQALMLAEIQRLNERLKTLGG